MNQHKRKIRLGFVSNSSSSSFVVAFKGDSFEEAFDREVWSPLSTQPEFVRVIVSQVGMTLSENINEDSVIKTTIPVPDDPDDDDWYDYYPLTPDEVNQLIADGFTLANGSVTDEDGGMAGYLRYDDIKFVGNDVRIYLGED